MKPEIGSIGRYGTSEGICVVISDNIDLTFWILPDGTPIDFYYFDEVEIEDYVWEN